MKLYELYFINVYFNELYAVITCKLELHDSGKTENHNFLI